MVEVGRDLWRSSGPTSLFKQGHLESVGQNHVQKTLEYLQGGDNAQPLWATCASHPHSEKVFLDVQREPPAFQFVLIASGPVSWNH